MEIETERDGRAKKAKRKQEGNKRAEVEEGEEKRGEEGTGERRKGEDGKEKGQIEERREIGKEERGGRKEKRR